MTKLQLDSYCKKIILIMTLKGTTMRFNQLLKTFEDMHIEITNPTLNDHLKHLINDGYITRKAEIIDGKYHSTYTLEVKKIGNSKRYVEKLAEITKAYKKEDKEFFSLPVQEQIQTILDILGLRKLYEFKARIDCELDSENFEKQMGVLFWTNPELQHYELLFLKKCIVDKSYRTEALAIIDKMIEGNL